MLSIYFSRAAAVLMASSGNATSMSFLRTRGAGIAGLTTRSTGRRP